MFDGRIALNWSDYNQRWRDTCLGATQAVVVYQGVLYSGSHAHDCASMGAFPDGKRHHLLAQTVDDPTLLGWFPTPTRASARASARAPWSSPRPTPRTTCGPSVSSPRSTACASRASPASGRARARRRPRPRPPSASPRSVPARRRSRGARASTSTTRRSPTTSTATTPRRRSTPPRRPPWFWDRPQLSFTDTNQLLGSTHTYRVGVTDGDNTVYSPWRSVTIASTVVELRRARRGRRREPALALRRGVGHLLRRLHRQRRQRHAPGLGDLPGRARRDRATTPAARSGCRGSSTDPHRQRPRRRRAPTASRRGSRRRRPRGGKLDRLRQPPDRQQLELRQARVHAEQRASRLRRLHRLDRHDHLDRLVQRRRLAPRRRDAGPRRHGAVRRRRAGRAWPHHDQRELSPATGGSAATT